MMQRLWKSVQRILRYFGSEQRVRYETKLVVLATFLEIFKTNFRSTIYTQKAFMWFKNCKNSTWFVFCLRHKIGCHGNVPWGIGKNVPDSQHSHKYLPFGEKIVKIGPVDPEIALLNLKKRKKEINASKIDSPSGKFAERAKWAKWAKKPGNKWPTDSIWNYVKIFGRWNRTVLYQWARYTCTWSSVRQSARTILAYTNLCLHNPAWWAVTSHKSQLINSQVPNSGHSAIATRVPISSLIWSMSRRRCKIEI